LPGNKRPDDDQKPPLSRLYPGIGVQRLLAAGLIEERGSALQPTARCDATFNYSRRWEPPRLSALYGAADTNLAKPLTSTCPSTDRAQTSERAGGYW
jgi:hypothetical protein